ncbi:TetM/TetW/TetO/TetS family tetracycline resistance ribosomal protection protein [Clostridium sp. HMP27]|uniref:GTP-binding protein n=1 Tax=Clostridium sp. HMP27 TaxID=1487921 RepID=UPI00052BEA11|nr:TetM/TetW/TetO/TetS family tetracycline resistance ribosomal protection protein [Clostridium sp. HMP27]KGK88547.1 GTP-binding protein [Clostridium sp. HMP27]
MTIKNSIRNIGIVAHVDAGKTTLTEQLLYQSGSSRTLGSVDKGTTHTDSLDIEKQRGISVKASETDLYWKKTSIYIIDTPGHIDFSAEVERSIAVLDGAVVVLSSVEGVQPQTEVYFNALKQLNTPTIFFINKLDRIGSSPDRILEDMKKLLSNKLVPIQLVSKTDDGFSVENLFDKFHNIKTIKDIDNEIHKLLVEDIVSILCDNNEDLLQQYLEDSLAIDTIKYQIEIQAKEGKIYPVLFGTTLRGEGVTELLDSIINYLPGPVDLDDSELSALVYKISHHKTLGKTAHLKLFSGKMESRDEIFNINKDKKEKVTVIKKIVSQKQIDIKSAASGDLVMVSGLDCSTYDILGSKTHIPKLPSLASPLLTLKIYAKKEEDYIPLVEALNILQAEDPLLNMEWIKEKKEIHIQIMGKIQLEIIQSILMERFNIEVAFDSPSVIYKETPVSSGYGEESYTMPKPCWAVVDFLIEPLPRGSGIIYESKVRTEKVKLKYQREIENNLDKILQQGIYGWNVTDLRITFVEGEDHVLHSRSGDFATATAMALMKGLTKIGTTLLEPMINFRITVPEDICGKVLNDIIQMRGVFENPTIHNNAATIEGVLPVATSLEYSITLSIISSGKAVISTKFAGYEPCSLELGAKRERFGVNPLDRAKYILYARNAL